VPLLVCRTCPRDDRNTGAFGSSFDRAVTDVARARGLRVRHVPCLGGCPHSGNVGLDAMGKARVRFSGISPDDAGDLVEAAAAYDASPTGMPGDWTVPPSLAPRLTAVTPKRILGEGSSCSAAPRGS
jgi:predicted metal-binding protein